MLVRTITLIPLLIFVLGCSKNLEEATIQVTIAPTSPAVAALSQQVIDYQYKTDFFENNVLRSRSNSESTAVSEEANQLLNLYTRQEEKFASNYQAVKQILLKVRKLDDPRNDVYAQKVTQTYLRHYFLNLDTEESKREVAFLITSYLYTEPVDLDVLTDALVFARAYISDSDQAQILDHIREVYSDNMKRILSEFEEQRDAYENASDEYNQRFALLSGIHLQRIYESTLYAEQKLALAVDNR